MGECSFIYQDGVSGRMGVAEATQISRTDSRLPESDGPRYAAARDRAADVVNDVGESMSLSRMFAESKLPNWITGATTSENRYVAGIADTFTGMVAAAVTLIVGIYVFSQISSTMPTPQNSDLKNATDTVKSTTGNAFTLGAVAIIVLVAVVILALISSGFGGGGDMR